MNDDFNRILIIRLSGAGDIIYTLPLLAALRRHYPESFIAWLVAKKNKEILAGHPYIDEIITFDRENWASDLWRLIPQLRERKFDMVIDPQSQLRSGVIALLSGAPMRLGLARGASKEPNYIFTNRRVRPNSSERHNLDRDLSFARYLGIDREPIDFSFYIGEENEAVVDAFLKKQAIDESTKLIGISIGGSIPSKRWREENWAILIDRLYETYNNIKPIILWGPGEENSVKKIVDSAKIKPLVTPKTGWKQLAAFLKKCFLVIGNDSGPLHIGVAVGTKAIGLYGIAIWSPEKIRPYGPQNIVVRKDSELDMLSCPKSKCRRCRRHDCMDLITPGDVLEAVKGYPG
ncbi:MAG: glycosyltransferase family 9 protein [bacterium]|nr:glycosyltransferase family 9 protein [bacterium]